MDDQHIVKVTSKQNNLSFIFDATTCVTVPLYAMIKYIYLRRKTQSKNRAGEQKSKYFCVLWLCTIYQAQLKEHLLWLIASKSASSHSLMKRFIFFFKWKSIGFEWHSINAQQHNTQWPSNGAMALGIFSTLFISLLSLSQSLFLLRSLPLRFHHSWQFCRMINSIIPMISIDNICN